MSALGWGMLGAGSLPSRKNRRHRTADCAREFGNSQHFFGEGGIDATSQRQSRPTSLLHSGKLKPFSGTPSKDRISTRGFRRSGSSCGPPPRRSSPRRRAAMKASVAARKDAAPSGRPATPMRPFKFGRSREAGAVTRPINGCPFAAATMSAACGAARGRSPTFSRRSPASPFSVRSTHQRSRRAGHRPKGGPAGFDFGRVRLQRLASTKTATAAEACG
jgi:hypothetical protein